MGSKKCDVTNVKKFIRQANMFLDKVAAHHAVAQGVYDTQPRATRPMNYAQRTYDNQPAVPRPRHFAQGLTGQDLHTKISPAGSGLGGLFARNRNAHWCTSVH